MLEKVPRRALQHEKNRPNRPKRTLRHTPKCLFLNRLRPIPVWLSLSTVPPGSTYPLHGVYSLPGTAPVLPGAATHLPVPPYEWGVHSTPQLQSTGTFTTPTIFRHNPRYRKPYGTRQPWKNPTYQSPILQKLSKEQAKASIEMKFVDKYSTITNTAIFNISSLILTPVQKVVLGLGTKYIPYPKTDFKENIMKMTDAISTYRRRIRLASFFGHSPYTPSSIPIIENKEKWHPPIMNNFDKPFRDYIEECRNRQVNYFVNSKSFFHESDQLLLNTLNRLSKNTHITIKPADKNLGLVIMNTLDYKISCLQHLNDITTYSIIQN